MSDLLENHMSTSHNIKAHTQEVWDKSNKKIKGGSQSGRKVVTHNSKSDLPLVKRSAKNSVEEYIFNLYFKPIY